MINQHPVILFDGICNLCSGWVQFLIRKDTNMKFRFAPIQSKSGQKQLHTAGLDSNNMETVIYLKGNECFRESSAVLEILKDLGGIWSIAYALKLIPGTLRNGFYRFIAKKRYRFFGKRASCFIPTPENQKRFLT
jgi:predicted DCC family thiol-disulfide oxidoreductase YuxK